VNQPVTQAQAGQRFARHAGIANLAPKKPG